MASLATSNSLLLLDCLRTISGLDFIDFFAEEVDAILDSDVRRMFGIHETLAFVFDEDDARSLIAHIMHFCDENYATLALGQEVTYWTNVANSISMIIDDNLSYLTVAHFVRHLLLARLRYISRTTWHEVPDNALACDINIMLLILMLHPDCHTLDLCTWNFSEVFDLPQDVLQGFLDSTIYTKMTVFAVTNETEARERLQNAEIQRVATVVHQVRELSIQNTRPNEPEVVGEYEDVELNDALQCLNMGPKESELSGVLPDYDSDTS
ncbi:hypothetical protein G7046_g3894 [Stylonectria norvegica]|nr:hypothetical protein G7046_g3894 [Stylonectria norvegica]